MAINKLFKKPTSVAQLKAWLDKLPQSSQVLISSDEEQNTLYKGFYVSSEEGAVKNIS